MKQRAHLVVSGRVQGVCFRMVAREEASRLGLSGWVRNRPDSTVEVVVEGDAAALDAFRAWCAQGPPSARVLDVQADFSEATHEFAGFRIAY